MRYDTEHIWKDFSGGIRSFISFRVSNPSYIDDIMQEVFIKIHSSIGTLKDGSKIRSWVYQIARNTIIDYYRKHKVQLENIEDLTVKDGEALTVIDEIEDEVPEKEIAAGLKGMIDALPEKYSQALLLVEFQGLSQVELAETLGISVSGAKSRVQRARQMLRDSLMRCCHFEFDRYGTIIDFRPNPCCCCCTCG